MKIRQPRKIRSAPARSDRNLAIDALRGCSILIVMTLHGVVPFPGWLQTIHPVQNAVANGMYGVSIFFVISGFLISSNTISRYQSLSGVHVNKFFAMRVARIFPCIILFFLLRFVLFANNVSGFVPSPRSLFYDGVKSLFQLSYGYFYWTVGNVPGMLDMSPLWSLSIEETFYLIFPIACFLLSSDRLIIWLLGGLVLLGPHWRSSFNETLMFWGAVDLLAMGCIAAKITSIIRSNRRYQPFWAPLVIAGIAILVACFGWTHVRTDARLALSAIGIGSSLLLIGVSLDRGINFISNWMAIVQTPLGILGKLSLPLYIFHVMARILFPAANLYGLAAGVIVFAWLLDRFLLEPANKKIRSFYKARSVDRQPPALPSVALSASAD
jgi:peptidoglycan/LPS O-acetylase OafA/YrhL